MEMCNMRQEKIKIIKKQEAKELLSKLGIKTPLSKIPVLGDFCFKLYQMKETVNNFLLVGDTFMPEIHLR